MNILVLNGSPRPNGNTKQMIDAFSKGAAFSYEGDFLDYLGLQDMGFITVAGGVTGRKLREAETLGKNLK